MKLKSGKLTAVIGASRSGKSQYIKSKIAGARVMIWDIKGDKDDYSGIPRARNREELAAMVKQNLPQFIYTPNFISEFDYFCRSAQAWVKSNYLRGVNCVLIFEETADVTSPAKAPESYGVILRRYLSYGVDIFAVTQRPAESDKTAVGNASIVHVCRMQLDRDRKAVARDTGIPLHAIEALKADQDAGIFDYIHADTGVGKYNTGRLTFRAGKAVFTDNRESKPL